MITPMSCDLDRMRWMFFGVIALIAFLVACLGLFFALCFASARSNAPAPTSFVKRSTC